MPTPDYYVADEGPSYSAAWGLAQERTAPLDAEYMPRLNETLRREREAERGGWSNERSCSPETVREIRRLVAAGVPQSEVARRFGLARGTVDKIVKRKRYAEIA